MSDKSRSNPDEELKPVLSLMRTESWFIGAGVVAILVAVAAAFVLDARDPARTVAEAVIARAIRRASPA